MICKNIDVQKIVYQNINDGKLISYNGGSFCVTISPFQNCCGVGILSAAYGIPTLVKAFFDILLKDILPYYEISCVYYITNECQNELNEYFSEEWTKIDETLNMNSGNLIYTWKHAIEQIIEDEDKD